MSYNQSENPAKRVKLDNKSVSDNKEIHVEEVDHVICIPGQQIGPYKIDKKIGEGAFGRVLLGTDIISGKCAALKVMKNDPAKSKVAITEISALALISRLDPQNEMMGLSVYDFIKANNFESFPIDQVRHISYQLCKAVDFLHRNGMTHTDLKPENILFVNSDYEMDCNSRRIKCTDIRLIDFGLLIRDKEPHCKVVSTRYYRAPEVILELGWSHPCDVWSIGCILVEIYYGSPLFDTHEDREHLAIMEKTLGSIPLNMINGTETNHFVNEVLDWIWLGWEGEKDIAEYFMPLKGYMLYDSDDHVKLFELIEKLLIYEPTKRILISEALTDPFFDSYSSLH